MLPVLLVYIPVTLFTLLFPVLLVGGIAGAAFPGTRPFVLPVLRAGIFGAMAGAGVAVLASLVFGPDGFRSATPKGVASAAAWGFNILTLIAVKRGLKRDLARHTA